MNQPTDSNDRAMVYIVTEGSYSDYHIVAVFDNEEAANELVGAIEDGRIEAWEVNNVSPIPPGMKVYYVSFAKEWRVSVENNWDRVGKASVRYSLFEKAFRFTTCCFARSEEHALKIGSERRAFMVATYGDNVDSEHDFGK